ncbi:uncharacterized protein CcaverHIS019_0509230 [Cutaneotrichosporon cavernicola]|uniref:Kinesin motor domain-containing protein n=1 Tax=Cutaneotrichosporon cavernicola TaxID=279322 RepID=A0AA48L7E0_9TREE|nr:uncharacterized protein CcaverHIS019_0509230 [Cutaneotrichosporon cavernicola]BEI93295.1 hypothetical protein CcaverHIS019_0509230 [Cutaneotrichosporon cavernicola]BEJ01072.1 hypothetical protein CcaverHIS631_0509290 [Cutaneotrichosporon cavernicola]
MPDSLTPSSSSQSIARSPSSPSLAHAVGLPAPLPDSGILPPSSPPKFSTRFPSGHFLPHVGEVDSLSSSTSSTFTMAELPSTPRRKIVNALEVPTPRSAKKKRSTLQDRLGSGTTKIPRPSSAVSYVSTTGSTPLSIPSTPGPSRQLSKSSDKVVVCMRIKPTTSAFAPHAYEVTPHSLTLSNTHPNVMRRGGKAGRESEYTYNFDTLVQYPTRTPELYNDKIAPLVQQAMNGFNSTVFAYGQTGSGKSHTMSGTHSELGIIPCAVDGIFDAITADPERAFLLRVSYLEIYKEGIRDLLCPGKRGDEAKVPTIKTAKGKDGHGKVFVDPLEETIVSTPQDVVEILSQGNSNRKTGATDWNDRSSRSHAVFTVTIESRPRDSDGHDEVRVSRLTLIDLAGSEKAVSNVERRGEGKYINQSLLALREVVHKLTDKGKSGHIPYRNSKLTHLLENVLGGDSNICVICTMSSEEEHCAETLETLKFASRCSQVETKAQKNILHGSDLAVIRAKDLEIAELKAQLESLASNARSQTQDTIPNEQISGLADELAAMEARKTKLAEQLSKLNSEILTSELPRSGAGLPMEQPRKRRPRISDFTSLTSASRGIDIGLGMPGTPKKLVDRRAVSTMVPVANNLYDDDFDTSFVDNAIETLDPSKAFDHDITIASLRRTIASRDGDIVKQAEELKAALAEAGDLSKIREELAATRAELDEATFQHANKLAETQETFEATQAALEKTVTEKTSRVDELEANIAELGRLHEKSSAEVQEQLAKAQADLKAATEERDEHVKEAEELKTTHADEITKIKDSIRALRTKADENAAKVVELEGVRAELRASLKAVETERDSARSDHATIVREAEQAKTDLEAFQTASAGRESDALASFKTELDGEREARTKAEATLEDATARATEAAEEKTRLEKELGDASEKLAAAEATNTEAETRIAEADATAKKEAQEASEAARVRHDELSAKIAALIEEREGHLKTGDELIMQLGTVKAQLEEKNAAHDNIATEIAEVKAELEKKAKSHQEASRGLDNSKAQLEAKAKELEAAFAERDEAKAALEKATAAHDDAARDLNTHLEAASRKRDEIKASLDAKALSHDEVSTNLAALKTELEEKTKALDDAVNQRDDIKTQLEAATALHVETAKELADFKVQLEEKAKVHAETESELDTAKTELAGKITALGETMAESAKLAQTLEDKSKTYADMQAKLETTKTELADKVTALAEATAESKRLAQELEEKSNAHTEVQAELETTKTELAGKVTSLDEAAETTKALEEQLADKSKAHAEVEGQLSTTKVELEEKAASLTTATTEIDSLRAGADVAASIRTELDEHRQLLVKEKTERTKLAEEHAAATARGDSLAKEVENTMASLSTEKEAHEATSTKLKTTKERIATLEAELAAAKTEREKLSTQLADSAKAREALSKQLTSSTSNSTDLQAKLDAAQTDLVGVRGELAVAKASTRSSEGEYRAERDKLVAEAEVHKRAAAAAEIRLASFTADSTLKHSELHEELAQARSSAEDAKVQLADHRKAAGALKEQIQAAEKARDKAVEVLKADLVSAKEARKAAEAKTKKSTAALASAEQRLSDATAEMAKIKAAHAGDQRSDSSLEKELTLAKTEYDAMKARCDRLASELVRATTSSPSKRPMPPGLLSSGSVPNRLSAAGSAALRGCGVHPNMEGWESSPAVVELSRLDKVVEAQKAVIEEQRDKISFWADELDKQREAVRLLTSDLESCTCQQYHAEPKRTPEGGKRGHMRASLSLSSVPSSPSKENLSPAPAGYASSWSRGRITPSFPALNLNMPSTYSGMPGSPTPLPMHPSQISNSRKHRRVTLENDINRLQGGGRVSAAKSVFDCDSQRVGSRHTAVRRG